MKTSKTDLIVIACAKAKAGNEADLERALQEVAGPRTRPGATRGSVARCPRVACPIRHRVPLLRRSPRSTRLSDRALSDAVGGIAVKHRDTGSVGGQQSRAGPDRRARQRPRELPRGALLPHP